MHAQRTEIATLNGIDFIRLVDKGSEKEAVAIVDELIGKNREEFPWIIEKEECQDLTSKASPLLASKFYYVHYSGTLTAKTASLNSMWCHIVDVVSHSCNYLPQCAWL